ncbi:MAG TPA: N-6 DNA methylase [Candidatus Hydrogenedentes bacterium]|nr:N-6 DNA methylase [Candidatus Hydrogenedentota bacterium]
MTQAQLFLNEAYEKLDFRRGDLVDSDLLSSHSRWVEKGDWAALAKHVGADAVFFVQENPVIVFAKQDKDEPEALRQLFSSVWCMSRPNLLFLARPGELAVYDLTQAPARTSREWEKLRPLDRVREVAEVGALLKAYHRAQIETGKLFEERRFGTATLRADKSLIQDLRTVRASLMKMGLAGDDLRYAHALIGRSIFIRYLEDRGVLTYDYFETVARKNRKWRAILASSSNTPYASSEMAEACYIKVLGCKDFTYALFRRLAHDFNGDMFPDDGQEEQVVTQEHLSLLQGFLRGDTKKQQKLFFWAYRFDIIPIELVSSIYEEFYTTKSAGKDSKGTHYTPAALAEFLVSQVLTRERLTKNPVILDPACGSGIFLVEAFRRIVRYRTQMQRGRRLDARQLRKILREQIRGIDINEEAIRVAAFSLYLALLHYQEPKDILQQIEKDYPLPCLVRPKDKRRYKKGRTYLDILQDENAFSPKADMKVDVVVGNPPWGHPAANEKEERVQAKVGLDWCKQRECPVGDEERSQAFIWRAIDFLHEDGCAGLLVSSGILHKIGKKPGQKSREFRKKWLEDTSLLHVADFARVRGVFFENAIAPFAAILFSKTRPGTEDKFQYSSTKMSEFVQACQAVMLSKNDIHWLKQHDFLRNDTLWKTYWLGGHRDAGFLANLKAYPSLEDLKGPDGRPRTVTGRGFQKQGGKLKPAGWLRSYKTLPTNLFTRCMPVDDSDLRDVPTQVFCQPPEEEVLRGPRLLFLQGIKQKDEPKGQVYARFETRDYCFEKSIYGIKLQDASVKEYHVLLGILWSSLARYYFFLTCAQWGTWSYQVLLDELRGLPIRFPKDKGTQQAISSAVKALRDCYRSTLRSPDEEAVLQRNLDEIVFDAYELSEWERDLVRDMCDVGIPFFYDCVNSPGARSLDLGLLPTRVGVAAGWRSSAENRTDIRGYLETFLRIWNRELEPEGEFSWQVIAPGNPAAMLAVVFSTQAKGTEPKRDTKPDEQTWKYLVKQLAEDSRTPFHSGSIYVDGLVRSVSPTQIVIIKRNAGRLWTRSAAREDAEATLLRAMQLDSHNGALA